jgi:hypothetical protein
LERKRILISLDDEQMKLMGKIKGMGNKDAEKIKNIVIAYLSEKSYIKDFNKSDDK